MIQRLPHVIPVIVLEILVFMPRGGLTFQTGGEEDNPFLLRFDEGPVTAAPGTEFIQQFDFEIPEKYYLYDEAFEINVTASDGIEWGDLVKPPSTPKEDPFFGRVVAVHFNEAHLTIPFRMPAQAWAGVKKVTGEIQFQGCSDKLCYRVMHIPFEISFGSSSPGTAGVVQSGASGFVEKIIRLIKAADFSESMALGFGIALLVAFLGGIFTDFTPCVWPLIPVTLAIIGVRKERGMAKNLKSVFVMVLGMSVMYSTLGLIAAMVGKGLGFFFQSVVFLVILDLILLFFALSLLGLFEIRLPSFLHQRLASFSASGLKGIFLVGLTLGLVAAPCVGPVVGPLLVYVAQTKNVFAGFFLLLAYALGMGVLFLVLGALYGVVTIRLKSGAWSLWLKRGLGVMVMLVAAYYAQTIYFQIRAGGAALNDDWIASVDKGLEIAAQQEKPVVIDFFARWCPPCLELDRDVWQRSEIDEKLKRDWVKIKVDCTKETAECRSGIDAYRVVGWPTVIFLDRNQKEIKEERLVGSVVSAEEMREILERVEKR